MVAGCAAAALAPAPVAAAADTVAPAPLAPATPLTPESVAVGDCHVAPLQADRYVTFAAEMASVHRTAQMWVRFALLERLASDSALHPATAPGLGVWQRSTPGIALFRYSQEVANLPAPGAYRALVSFRWYGPRHRLLRRARRETPLCLMPDERPHLSVGAVTRSAGQTAQTTRYAVEARNTGLGPASSVGVQLAIDGAVQPQQTIATLAPAASQLVTFDGPRCSAGGTLVVTLDPAGSVDQTTRADDVKTVACG